MSALILPPALGARVISREPYTDVRVDEAVSGKEARSSWWLAPRYRYKVAFEALRSDAGSRLDFQQLAGLFARSFGRADSFLFSDEADNSVSDHGFGVGDGATTAFQLQRSLLGATYDVLGGPWAQSSKPRTNLLTGSAGVLVGFNPPSFNMSGIVAPDGSTNASEVSAPVGGGSSYSDQVFSSGVGSYTASVWVSRVPGRAAASLEVYSDTLHAQLAAFTVPAGAGWQRVSVTFAAPAVGSNMRIYTNRNSTNSALRLWGGQIEVGTVATPYIPTAGTAVTQKPAYWPSYVGGFEPVFDVAPGALLFVEDDGLGRRPLSPSSRTNLCTQSQTLGTTWTQNFCTVGTNAATAPDGTATADTIIDNATTNLHDVGIAVAGLTVGASYVWSAYLKAGTLSRAWIMSVGGATLLSVDLLTGLVDGAATSASEYSITNCGGGWWRLALRRTAAATSEGFFIGAQAAAGAASYLGTGTGTVCVWGAQVELAPDSSAGDYIPTTTAAASRLDYVLGATGAVAFAVAPRSGAALSWSGSFYRRVRLAGEGLQLERLASGMWAATVDLVSVKP